MSFSFSAPTTTTTTAFGSQPSSGGFGGFGAPSTPATSTFGAAATPAPASTGFGFGSAAAPAATTSGFGSFGSVSTPTSGVTAGFGAAPAAGGFGSAPAPASTGFGTFSSFGTATATPGFGAPAATLGGFGAATSSFGASAFGAQPAAAPAAPVETCVWETRYKDLPDAHKKEIDRFYVEFKKPMKENLDFIGRAKGSIHDQVYQELKTIHLHTMTLETEQVKLRNEIKPFLEELKPFYHEFHTSGSTGLSQIRNRGGGLQGGRMLLLDEELPDKFYLKTAEKLEKRVKDCIAGLQYFERQLAARMRVLEAFVHNAPGEQRQQSVLGGRGQYGQVKRIGVAQLALLIKHQGEAFQRISMEVTAIHQAANEIRQLYLRTRGVDGNPFDAADRREAAEQKYMTEKIKTEQSTKVQSSAAAAPAAATPAVGAAPTSSGSGFGGFSTATSTFGTPTPVSSFGVPAPSSASIFGAPATATTTPTIGGFGSFGNTAAPAASGFGGFGSNPPAASGFGFGGASMTALDLAKPKMGESGSTKDKKKKSYGI